MTRKPIDPRFYVYAVFNGDECVYIGKGRGNRYAASARERGGSAVTLEIFDTEAEAYAREWQLIQAIRPRLNKLTSPAQGRTVSPGILGGGMFKGPDAHCGVPAISWPITREWTEARNTSAERTARLRAARKRDGDTEVRGIYVKPEDLARVRKFLRGIVAEMKQKLPRQANPAAASSPAGQGQSPQSPASLERQ